MLNDDIMGALLANSYKAATRQDAPIVKPDITSEEALKIFNEVIEIYKQHNISYQCACRITMALNEAFITGAIELYNQEQKQFPIGSSMFK